MLLCLLQAIEARLAMQRILLSLSGRLDLLLAQMPRHHDQGVQGSADDELTSTAPRVVYQESDSEEEVEVEDAFAATAADEDDDEDDDVSDEYEDDNEGDEGSDDEDMDDGED